MSDEVHYGVEIASVTETERAYFEGENEVVQVVHKVVAKDARGSLKLTLQGPARFPWGLGDVLIVKVATTQSKLEEFEEEGE